MPISSEGLSRAIRTASSNAAPVAMSVVAVRIPLQCAWTIPWFTSRVQPKSSALTTSLRTLENGELNAQELPWVRPEILHQAIYLAGGAVQILVERWIHQQLSNGSLAAVDFIEQHIQAAHGGLQLIVQVVALEQFAHRALPLVYSGQHLPHVGDGGSGVFIKRRVLQQFAERSVTLLQAVSQCIHASQRPPQIGVEA